MGAHLSCKEKVRVRFSEDPPYAPVVKLVLTSGLGPGVLGSNPSRGTISHGGLLVRLLSFQLSERGSIPLRGTIRGKSLVRVQGLRVKPSAGV